MYKELILAAVCALLGLADNAHAENVWLNELHINGTAVGDHNKKVRIEVVLHPSADTADTEDCPEGVSDCRLVHVQWYGAHTDNDDSICGEGDSLCPPSSTLQVKPMFAASWEGNWGAYTLEDAPITFTDDQYKQVFGGCGGVKVSLHTGSASHVTCWGGDATNTNSCDEYAGGVEEGDEADASDRRCDNHLPLDPAEFGRWSQQSYAMVDPGRTDVVVVPIEEECTGDGFNKGIDFEFVAYMSKAQEISDQETTEPLVLSSLGHPNHCTPYNPCTMHQCLASEGWSKMKSLTSVFIAAVAAMIAVGQHV